MSMLDPSTWKLGFGTSYGSDEANRRAREHGADVGIIGQEVHQLGDAGSWYYASGYPDQYGNTAYERTQLAVSDPAAYKRLYQDPSMQRAADILAGRAKSRRDLIGRASDARSDQLSAALGGGGPLQSAMRYAFSGSTPESRKASADESARATQWLNRQREQEFLDQAGMAQFYEDVAQSGTEQYQNLFANALKMAATRNPSYMLGSLADFMAGPEISEAGLAGLEPRYSARRSFQDALSEEQLGGTV